MVACLELSGQQTLAVSDREGFSARVQQVGVWYRCVAFFWPVLHPSHSVLLCSLPRFPACSSQLSFSLLFLLLFFVTARIACSPRFIEVPVVLYCTSTVQERLGDYCTQPSACQGLFVSLSLCLCFLLGSASITLAPCLLIYEPGLSTLLVLGE